MDSRSLFCTAKLSLDLGHEDIGVALLEHLLDQLPGHVAARCLLGHRCLLLERWAEAQEHFEYPLTVDPLNRSALKGMAHLDLVGEVPPDESESVQRVSVLYPYDGESRRLLETPWDDLPPLAVARILTCSGHHEDAVAYYQAAWDSVPEDPQERGLMELLLAQALWRAGRVEVARPLAEAMVREQPMWIRPRLILADISLQQRDDAVGVALLHDARALDPSDVVVEELLGQDDRYNWMMNEGIDLEPPAAAVLDGAPPVLRYLLGEESLPSPLIPEGRAGLPQDAPPTGTQSHRKQAGCASASVEATERACLLEAPELSGGPLLISEPAQRSRVRVILTSRDRITVRYGEQGFADLDARLSELCDAVAASTGDETVKVYVDDDASLAELGLRGIDASDAHRITEFIAELEGRLALESKQVASLLIVGGDSIIPFHRVDNQADDEDPEVLSDWPYVAAKDARLLSRFSVGRLPDPERGEVDTLLQLVDHTIAHHEARSTGENGVSRSGWMSPLKRLFGSRQRGWASVGYSAEIWAEASRSVFEAIGDPRKLDVSPPLTDYDFLSTYDEIPTLGYFNLHGFSGSPYWYGHGESDQGSPLLPVALTPLSVSWSSAAGAIIYSEACYGAAVAGEYPDGSIALNFLAAGALGFVGFTSMSYGTLAPPLSGADLLGKHLWEGILEGLPLGEALRRARASFIRTAAADQGYLDGEDQKALMSCVLYGDPALSLLESCSSPQLEADLEVTCPPLACCSRMMDAEALPLPKEVRQKVKRSLPFLETNGFSAHPLILCRVAPSGHKCGAEPCGCEREKKPGLPELLQASQQHIVTKGGDQLRHVVKVTLNADGDVIKVLMSRGGTSAREGSMQT